MLMLPASEARMHWADTMAHAVREPVTITQRGRERVVMLDAELAHRALAALEALADRAAVDRVREELAADPETVPLDEVARELGLTLD